MLRVFEAACQLRDAGQPIDASTVFLRLKETGKLADLGDNPTGYLADLIQPTGANLDYAAHQMREAAVLRALIRIGAELIREASCPTSPAEELAAQFEQRLTDSASGRVFIREPIPLSQAVRDAIDRYDDEAMGRRSRCAIPTGIDALDQVFLGGFTPGPVGCGRFPPVGREIVHRGPVRGDVRAVRIPGLARVAGNVHGRVC